MDPNLSFLNHSKNRRPLLSASNRNKSFFMDPFNEDNEKSKRNWSAQNILDWTMGFYKKNCKNRFNSDSKKDNPFLNIYVLIVYAAIAIGGISYFFLIKGYDTSHNFNQINYRKLEDDLYDLRKRLEQIGTRKIEPLVKVENLKNELKENQENFLSEKINEIEFKFQQRSVEKMNDMIRSAIDNLIETEISDQLNSKIEKKIEFALDDKLKQTSNQAIDRAVLDNSVRSHISQLILGKYEDDKKIDYASELNNAVLIEASDTFIEPNAIKLFSIPVFNRFSSSPSQLLKRNPYILEGNAKLWKMNGREGFVKIKLSESIIPISFAYEHMIRAGVLDENQLTCSPRVFRVTGYENENSDEPILLGRFDFEINEGKEAEFMFDNIKNKISVIKFNIESNHGNSNFTCLYRIKLF